MAAWLPGVIKASLPYVTQIITAAIPAFTSKPSNVAGDELVPKQIAELQTAVTHNAEAVKGLAVQLKETLEGIDQGAANLQRELTRMRRLVVAATAIAIAGLAVAVASLLG